MRNSLKKTVPNSKTGRTIVGVLFVIGGVLGFLPVLGFWMVPLGLLILSVDFPLVRRFRRRQEVKFGRWWATLQQKRRDKDETGQ